MDKIFGFKRWYEVKNEKYQKNNVMKKIRVKREYVDNGYIIKKNETNEIENINNKKFIEELKKYKTKKGKVLSVKFNIGNVLFKLPLIKTVEKKFKCENEVIRKIEVLEQSKKLVDFSKKKNNKFTRNKICNELIKQLNEELIDENSDNIIIDGEKIKLEINNKFDKNQSGYAIKWKILSQDEVNLKKKLYIECMNVNETLYNLLKLTNENDFCEEVIYEKRYYLKELEGKYLEKKDEISKILESLKKIKEIVKTEELINYIKFLFNITKEKKTSENKIKFSNQILNYIEFDIEIKEGDIVEFLIGELKQYEIIKRIENYKNHEKKENQKNCPFKWNIAKKEVLYSKIKTYITFDKHEKNKEKNKDEVIKKIIKKIENNMLDSEITNILKIYKITELKQKLEYEMEKNGGDTNLFGVLKKHYEEVVFIGTEDEIKTMSLEDKELYKISYRYLKGRIEKIIKNSGKNSDLKLNFEFLEFIFDEQNLLKKIIKRVEQYCLEYILYVGKIEHLFEEKAKSINTNEFVKEHANEELALELITLFSATNMTLNEFLGSNNSSMDYFGGDLDNKRIEVKKNKIATKYKLLEKLDFLSKDTLELTKKFNSFLKESYGIRNKILHGKYDELFSKESPPNLKGEYSKINEAIEILRTEDKDICKSLNFDIIFEGKENIIKKLNEKIDGINNPDTVSNKELRYFPSFTKLVPEIKKIIQENDKKNVFYDKNLEEIILNGAIYINKILYLNEITNIEESEFIKYLKKDLLKKHTIEELYKNAQISASKGNKKAIKNCQRKIIEEYLTYLKCSNDFKEILNFSDFKYNLEEVKEKIEKRQETKDKEKIIPEKFVLKSIKNKVEPRNDFEYTIAIFGLLNENIFINKIRNRFFSTDSWLNENKNENIVKILDEIIGCNILKYELCLSKNAVDELKGREYNKEFFDEIITKMENKNYSKDDVFTNKEIVDRELYKFSIKKCIEGKNFSDRYQFKFEGNSLSSDERGKIKKTNEKIKNFPQEIENILIKKSAENPIEILEKYDSLMVKLKENKKFKNIYYQEDEKIDKTVEKITIYKKNIFNNIGKDNFEHSYPIFVEEELKNVDIEIFELEKKVIDRDIPKKITAVDKVLKMINEKFKGYSKNYKQNLISEIKENKTKNILDNSNYKKFEDFLTDYNEVSNYKKNRDIVEFNALNKINHYLVEINWKLAIQMARLERDLHYIVRGMDKLNIITLKRNNEGILEVNTNKTKAYPKEKKKLTLDSLNESCYYKFKDLTDYESLKFLCAKLGIDLSEEGELQKNKEENIRNYISHFYIVRNHFLNKESLVEKIDKVSDLLNYRTKYNNSTYNSIFEVFKKDVNLNYSILKTKFRLDERKIEKIITPKKVSILDLDHYNGESNVQLIKTLLIYKK